MLNDKLHKLNESFDRKRDEFLKEWENKRVEAIAKVTVDDVAENLKNMSVGNIISIFENISPEILKTKGGKAKINKFVALVKEDKNLQNTYMLKENVFGFEGGCTARDVLEESIGTAVETSDKKSFKESKEKLVNFVSEALTSVLPVKIYNKVVLDEDTKKINDNLELLVWGKKTVKNAGARTTSINETVNFMHSNNLPQTTFTGKSSEEVFNECKDECINTIDEAWKTADSDVRFKLTEIKDRVSKKTYSELTVNDDIKYLKELTETVR